MAKRRPQKVLTAKYDSLQSLKSTSPMKGGQLVRAVSVEEDASQNLMSSLSLAEPSHLIHLFYDSSLAAQHSPDLGSDTEYERPERVRVIYEHLRKSMGPQFLSIFREFSRSDIETILTPEMLKISHTDKVRMHIVNYRRCAPPLILCPLLISLPSVYRDAEGDINPNVGTGENGRP